MGTIASLLVEIGADSRSFQKGMSEANAKLEETGAKGAKFGGLMAGAGLLAMGAVTGIVAFGVEAVHHFEESGQAAYEMSEKFGLSKTAASAYLSVGAQLGLSGEQIGKGFQFLSKNVSAMQLTLDAGGKISASTGQAYKELGINVLDSGGKVKSADELMMESADAFKKMEDGPVKASLAMKLFGKSGTDLLPVLNQGSAGIRKLMEDGKASGAVMAGPQVEAAHKLFLEHKQLDTMVGGLTTSVGSGLIPIALAAIPVFMGFAAAIGNTHTIITKLQPWLPLIAVGLTALAGVMGAVLIPMFITWTAATYAQVVALTAQAVAMVAAYWPILLIIGAIALLVGAVVLVMQHWDFLKAKTLPVWSDIKTHVLGIVTWFQGLPATFLKAGAGIGAAILKGITDALGALGGALSRIFSVGLHVMVGLLPGFLQGPVSGAFKSLGVPGFQFGGTVPGAYSGQPRLILAHAGETVTPQGQSYSGPMHTTTILPVVFSPIPPNREQMLYVHDQMRRLDRELR